MANMSNFMEERIINHYLRGASSTAPSSLHVGLFLNNPTDASTGTEVSGTGYARRPITFTAPTQVEGKAQTRNVHEIEFPVAGSNWGLVTHAAVYDALTGGNLYLHGPLANPKNVQTSDIIRALPNELVFNVD